MAAEGLGWAVVVVEGDAEPAALVEGADDAADAVARRRKQTRERLLGERLAVAVGDVLDAPAAALGRGLEDAALVDVRRAVLVAYGTATVVPETRPPSKNARNSLKNGVPGATAGAAAAPRAA